MSVVRSLLGLILGKRLPVVEGTIAVDGVHETVRIRRDTYGVPYINAENAADAWFGLGFCQGQDRSWQLESLMRVVRGSLAEIIGPDALTVDELSRRIGFSHYAKRQLLAQTEELRAALSAFAAGVNAGRKHGVRKKAHEFTLLKAEPSQYEAHDVLALFMLIAFLLASNWDAELARYKILLADGAEALAALDPSYPEWTPVTTPPGTLAGPAFDALARDLAAFTGVTGMGGGSNNWAISGARTQSGRPLLANDPHLAPVAPAQWYLASVRTPQWGVCGASFVGSPGIIVGHNGTAAWGVTAAMTDNTDLFIETVGPDGRSVKQGDRFVPCEVRTERIAVKGAETVEVEVLETPRGPIVGPAFDGDVGAISMSAVWLQPRNMSGLLSLQQATSFESFRKPFEDFPSLPLNMVYADTSGDIGWQSVGLAPVRRRGYGTIPLDGSDPSVGWKDDLLPFEEMPRALNPKAGFIATANNQPTVQGDSPFLGIDFAEGYRVQRIGELIAAKHDWDLLGSASMQMDELVLPWRDMREVVLEVPAIEPDAVRALEILSSWDGRAAVDSEGAAVYELFVADLVSKLVAAKAPNSKEWVMGQGFSPLTIHTSFFFRRVSHLVRLLREQPDQWLDVSWPEAIATSLGAAIEELRSLRGDRSWAWGQVRTLTFAHPFGEKPPMDKVFNIGPFPWGGDASTLGQAAVNLLSPTDNSPFVVSMRMTLDVGNWDENRFVLPGGQSGNPFSPHYRDQIDLWRAGDAIDIAWSEDAIQGRTKSTLELVLLKK